MIWEQIYQLYQEEMNFFEKKVDELFEQIVILETKMTKRKQKKLQQDKRDLDQLYQMIIFFLKNIALIESYRYFQIEQIPLSNEKLPLFCSEINKHFENLLIILLLKIKNEESIDFNIT